MALAMRGSRHHHKRYNGILFVCEKDREIEGEIMDYIKVTNNQVRKISMKEETVTFEKMVE